MMGERRILLATGSRALHIKHGGSLQSEEWAKSILRRALFSAPMPDYLVHGGAMGPDTWAHTMARGPGSFTGAIEFHLDGNIYLRGELYKRWRHADGPEANPLRRNDQMVAHCAQAMRRGWQVECLALLASWPTTRGTAYTARIAEEAGFSVTRETCPMWMQGRQR